ncbi:MAG: 4Fe-4S dicluster domain-containing protein [Deltaproteobacteria bacterium]|nr:4Fe-4S dicluster domain-containing protein [Deltaproteobacteria bacterium]
MRQPSPAPAPRPLANELKPGVSRRAFMQLLGAAGIAGLPGCFRRPPDEVAPYATTPEGVVPGVPRHFATALERDGYALGVLVTSHDGRPTKIEGNPAHPASLGATDAGMQAAVLDLYDPARLQTVRDHGQAMARDTFLERMAALRREHLVDGGAHLHLLLAPTSSPTLISMVQQLRTRFPRATVHSHRPLDTAAWARASKLAYGRVLRSRFDLNRAEVCVALDSDFFSFGPERLRLAREWSDRRVDPMSLNQLFVAETGLSLAGSVADDRLAARPSALPQLALALVRDVSRATGQELALPDPRLDEVQQKFIQRVSRALVKHRGRAVVLVDDASPELLQAAAILLNALVAGELATLLPPVELDPLASPAGLTPLIEAAARGEVRTLISNAFDPVYTAPADVDVRGAFARIRDVIHLGELPDATWSIANLSVPRSHPLESWGDVRAVDGTVSFIQPLIAALYDSFTMAELLSALVNDAPRSARELLEGEWRPKAGADFEEVRREILRTGVVANSQSTPVRAAPDVERLVQVLKNQSPQPTNLLELNLSPDRRMHAGEQSNNVWLQECPDALTQLAWDNALLLSPSTASSLGVSSGEEVELVADDQRLVAPVLTLPGHAEGAATLHLGHGRYFEGEAPVGVDAYVLRTRAALDAAPLASITRTGRTRNLAFIQIEGSDQDRKDARELDVSALEPALSKLAKQRQRYESLFPPVEYHGYRWAMAIDLSRCMGCQACVVACQAENNVPSVGRDEVMRGREMHWLRVDRYFTSEARVQFHPLMCVHCEHAPCEYVCPVNATVHSDEGLNEMVYNRCVGTRYCSNNCPYKVRRFNFHAYGDQVPRLAQLAMNPEVTQRSRGVMEKCSYCVQRIEAARIHRELEHQPIRDGDIVTACQQACPTHALTFGTLSDPNARVSQLHADPRRYDLLGELGTRPRTGYLARLTHRPSEAE